MLHYCGNRNVWMLPWNVFRFLKIDACPSLDTENSGGKQNFRIQVFTLQNFTTGFSKKGFVEGCSIRLPQHRLNHRPNRTFFSNWNISRQGIKRLALLPCRQRSVKQKRRKCVEIISIIKSQCLKTSLRAIKSAYSLSYFAKKKQC